jgi:membrane protein DedA with SNARE-associated domain
MAKEHWLKKNLIPILTVLLALVITVVLFIFRGKIAQLGDYGYLGAFLVGLISCATIILPVPGILVLFALGADPNLNPVLVGLAGATGGVIGEMTGYMAGYGGRKIIKARGRLYALVEKWMKRWGGWAIFAFAAAPLPIFDIAGMVAGALGYPVWKFLLFAWPGKSIKYIILVLAGAWGWHVVLGWFG